MYPALSLAQALSGAPASPGVCNPEPRIVSELLFVGTRGGMEEALLKRYRLPYAAVNASPVQRGIRAAAGGAAKNVRGLTEAVPIVARFKPDVIVATGGYASVPTVLAAVMLRSSGTLRKLKVALLEPNVTPGRANRLLARVADEVWGAFPETAQYFPGKFIATGIPVRPDLYALPPRAEACAKLSLDPAGLTVLVFGGSQGARTINVAASALAARRRLPSRWQVIHLAGHRDFEWMAAERKAEPNQNRYALLPYLEDMAAVYAAADVAVCRAGASTLAELAVVGLPSILVPYPHATDDHQRRNAAVFEQAGAALVVENAKLDADSLYWALNEALDPAKHATMRASVQRLAHPRALHSIVERIVGGRIGAPLLDDAREIAHKTGKGRGKGPG